MNKPQLNTQQIEALESINRQIEEQGIPNTEPVDINALMNESNSAANANTFTYEGETHHGAETASNLLSKLKDAHYGAIDGNYFYFTSKIFYKYLELTH